MIELRDYQLGFINHTHEALRKHRRVCAVAPCGAGKRYMAVWWGQKIAERQKKLLVVTNRRILVDQMVSECRNNGVQCGVIMGSEPRNESALVQVASIQTLTRREWRDMPECDWIIVDECHRQEADYCKLFEQRPNAKCVGLTATPVGLQGRSLVGQLYDTIVEPVKNSSLIERGLLLKTKVFAPSEPDIKGVNVTSGSGEYNQEKLAKAMEQCTVFADVFKHWTPYSHMQTVVFAPKVKYAYGLADQFKEHGFDAGVIEAGTSKSNRSETIDAFKAGQLRVMISVDVLREGFDATIAQVGIDLQPNFQLRTYWQKVGRVKRAHPGQDHAIWLDFAGNFWRFPHPDEDFDWSEVSGEKTTQDLLAEKEGKQCKECGSKDLWKGACQDCGARVESGSAKEPWSCHSCSYTLSPWERLTNGVCPGCGTPVKKSIRRIRMADGKLKEVTSSSKEKKKASQDQRVWDQCRWQSLHSGRTMGFARWLYRQRTGRYPDGLDFCPRDPDSGDWRRLVSDVFPSMRRGPK